jgi:predicted nucleotidyltransferase component of viral defense system
MQVMIMSRQLREVFHFCFLERLLRIADANLFVLKGGVNLRFFFHSPRYSEDMDLDVLAGSVATLKKNGYKLLQDAAFRRMLRTYGIADIEVNDSDKAKHTLTTQRGPMHDVPSEARGSASEQIDPELARQYNRLSFRCQHYTGEAAILQNVLALAGRALTQARDVFDLDVLQRAGHTAAVVRLLAPETLATALANLDTLTFEEFSGQVLEFLGEETRQEYDDRTAWDALVVRVRQLLAVP